MTERERLIELIDKGEKLAYSASVKQTAEFVKKHHRYNSATDNTVSISEMVTDYLLENGVIVPPVKVGDTVFYVFYSDDSCRYEISELIADEVSDKSVWTDSGACKFGIDEFGTTAFISYTAAKEAAESLNNEK